MKDRERDQEANVVDTAVQVLGGVAARLDWPRYQQLLGTFSRAMQRTEGKVRRAARRALLATPQLQPSVVGSADGSVRDDTAHL